MDIWTSILLTWACATITAHALLFMWYVMACYAVWKQADRIEGLIRVTGRALVGTTLYAVMAMIQWSLVLGFGAIFSMSPEAVTNMQEPVGLASGAAVSTFLLPWVAASGNLPLTLALVLASFILLGLASMLPGAGHVSKLVWGAIGLAGYAAYLFITIAVSEHAYRTGALLILISMSVAGLSLFLCSMLWSGPVDHKLLLREN